MISSSYSWNKRFVLYLGDYLDLLQQIPNNTFDLSITSPPYFMGKEYDKSKKIEDFVTLHSKLLPEIIRVTKKGGSICWQIGYHLKNGIIAPLDYFINEIMFKKKDIYLRNRIIWTYGHGLHCRKRFSGRHEVLLWYTKGKDYYFDLDSVRIAQKYPGKKYYRGKKKGDYSCNPLGKNPSDIWNIPNVKANHIEKTNHPCQFPIALVQMAIRSLTPINGVVFDPFIGSGSTAVAAIIEKRRFVGAEINKEYYKIAKSRCIDALNNRIKFRPIDKPIFKPSLTTAVAQDPFSIK